MTHIRILVPVVPSDSLPGPDEILEIYAPLRRPDLVISCRMIERGPMSIEGRKEEAEAVPGLITLAVEAEADGVDAVVIDCMGDPGVDVLREIVSIPVLGPARTSMTVAANIGHRFSILTVLERSRPLVDEQVERAGLSGRLASVRVVDLPVLEIESHPDETFEKLMAQAERAARDDRADVIIPGCTGYVGLAESIEQELHARGLLATVLDPMPLTIRMAAVLAESGHSHPKSAYMAPG
ncbi:MAG: hydrogenase expression protein HupH [Gammaproteobacteria bacterium]|nr:hydrogenase expression protein HupH [Gammaproteobacteria bacterium]